MQHEQYLLEAIEASRQSVAAGGFPAGAVIVKDSEKIATGISIGNLLHDPTSHGEVAAIREAGSLLNTSDLTGTTIYTSLEPCSMCLSAAMWAGVTKIVYACSKTQVDSAFYGGTYASDDLNRSFTTPVELIHMESLQDTALEVIHEWQKHMIQ